MKTKFTKASRNDKTLVTVQLAQFDNTELEVVRYATYKGEEIVLVVEGVPVVFTVNRANKYGDALTATTHTFPRFLRLPQIGRPVTADVQEVR